jgi:uncharacterized protein involved in cysteine biosynthesis
MGFFRGFFAPFRGGLYMLRHPLKRYLFMPFVLSAVLAVATMIGVHTWLVNDIHGPNPLFHVSPPLDWLVMAFLTLLFGAVLFLIGQPVLNAVFVDRLSERVERDVVGTAPTAPFFASTGRALVHGLLKLVLYGIAFVVGLGLTAVTGGLGSLIGIGLGALSLAYDGFDYPLARRHATFGAKWAFLARHPGLTVGYGIGATLLYLIPFAVFVASPFAAVGATLAYIDLEKPSTGAATPTTATPPKSANVAANS